MDLYEVMIIVESTGNRIQLIGVEAEVQPHIDSYELKNPFGETQQSVVKGSWLDMVFTVHHPDVSQYEELKESMFQEDVLVHFKDVHPNLIRCRLLNMTWDSEKITFELKGNTIDKTYLDYVTEATNQLNAHTNVYRSKHPKENEHKQPLPKAKKKEIKKLKRKLTF